jgi:hypothetical protein
MAARRRVVIPADLYPEIAKRLGISRASVYGCSRAHSCEKPISLIGAFNVAQFNRVLSIWCRVYRACLWAARPDPHVQLISSRRGMQTVTSSVCSL